MRLYLSSFKLGNAAEKIISLVNGNKNAVIILNALDHHPEVRSEFLRSQTKSLSDLGLHVTELDLREYFDKPNELKKVLEKKDFVWVNGGNTFILRRAMKQSGFDDIVYNLIKSDSIAYGGFSAGSVIVTPTLKGLDIIDSPNKVPAGYNPEIIWDGLNLIDFSIAVHYDSDHPESALIEDEIEYYKKNKMPYKTLKDGQAIIVQDDEIETVG